jgi:hypothetical protein
MKRNILHGALVAGLSAAALSSCIENNGNQISLGNVASTVVRSEYGYTVVQDDYTHYYYYADEFEDQGFQMGDRVLLSSWTVDYDNQPSNAYGTVNSPLKMSKVELPRSMPCRTTRFQSSPLLISQPLQSPRPTVR